MFGFSLIEILIAMAISAFILSESLGVCIKANRAQSALIQDYQSILKARHD